jgi:hypothetical protein
VEYKESVKGDDKEGDEKEGDIKEKRGKKGLKVKVKKGVKNGEENEEMYNDMKAEEADNIYKAINKDDKEDKEDKEDKDDKESNEFYEDKSDIEREDIIKDNKTSSKGSNANSAK